jgi:hypothetical protein
LSFACIDNICNLQNQKHQLEQFVFWVKNSNENYLKTKDVAEETINRLLTDEEPFLDLALKAVIEALRLNPEMYAIIYNGKYDNNNGSVFDNSSTTVLSSSHPYSPILQNQNYYYNKYHEGLLGLTKGFLNILLNQVVDKTMVAAMKEKEK